MAKHFASCECASCEEHRDKLGTKLRHAVQRSVAYTKYVLACQKAQQDYKEAVRKAREEYETSKIS